MAGSIIPLPNTRISGLLMTQRLTKQLQSDQLDLFRLQEQISTGQRVVLPSDDAPAALRAISLQRLIERKGQLETNIQTGQSFLAATDTALNQVAKELSDLRGAALGVAGTIATDQERNAAIADINGFLESLVALGNRQFRGRYLFAGAQTSEPPYSFEDTNVVYKGDNRSINSFSDIGVLFASNAPGDTVFGGFSAAAVGTVDLNPQVNTNTLLSSLRGGRGISPNGSFTISDGTNTSTIDLSRTSTVGDVVRLIQENPPLGRQVDVAITANGIDITLDGGNLSISEVATGTAAQELGIIKVANGLPSVTGTDVDPVLLKTDRLEDLLGSKARATIASGLNLDNNDISLEATANGLAFDGVAIQYVDDDLLLASAGLSAGSEVAQYDPAARAAQAAISFLGGNNDLLLQANTTGTSFNNVQVNITSTAVGAPTASFVGNVLTIDLEADGSSDANQVIAAIGGLAGNPFTASLDTSVETLNDGTGAIAAVTQTNFANTGNSGGAAKTLYLQIDPGVSTANNVINAINTEGTFTAQVDPSDTSSASAAGTGLVDINAAAVSTSGGSGTTLDQTSGIRVVNGGQTYNIAFTGAQTVADLLNTLNGSQAGLYAEINADADGINVHSRVSGDDFQIGENGGTTATQLGIRTNNSSTKLNELNFGNGVSTKGGFNLPTVAGTDLTIDTIDGLNFSIDLSAATSVTDVVNAINTASGAAGASVVASEVTTGNVTVVQLVDSGVGGADFTLTSALGSSAGQYLGIVPDGVTQVAIPNPGTTFVGTDTAYTDLTITAKDGQTFSVDLSATTTVGEVLTEFNNAATAAGVNVTAQLAAFGNGFELVDTTGGGGSLTVTAREGVDAARQLGLVTDIQTPNSTTGTTLTGTDQNFLETDSVFNTLIRLRDALTANDLPAIERAVAKIDADINRVTFARAEVGARQQGLEIAGRNLQDEDIQLRSALSDEIDVDLIEAISALTARQVALEASLRVSANILQLSLLNFI